MEQARAVGQELGESDRALGGEGGVVEEEAFEVGVDGEGCAEGREAVEGGAAARVEREVERFEGRVVSLQIADGVVPLGTDSGGGRGC